MSPPLIIELDSEEEDSDIQLDDTLQSKLYGKSLFLT